jgi:ribosomal-protein-alanine N-acetyltransferase
MSEDLQTLLRYGFTEMDLNRIQAMTHSENYRSQKVLLKLGFQKDGLLRIYFGLFRIYNDQVLFSILQKDWLLEKCEKYMIKKRS